MVRLTIETGRTRGGWGAQPQVWLRPFAYLDTHMNGRQYDGVSTVFEVLAEPNRRRLLDLLREEERPVGDLVEALAISQPAVSKHLRILRDAGLVSVRPDGRRRLYQVRPEPLRAVDHWLMPYRALWEARLDALQAHLDHMPDD